MSSVFIVNSICLNMFSAEVNSTLLSQLTAKGYEYVPEEMLGTPLQSIVYILGDNRILGMGVCVRSASVLVHTGVIGNEREPEIYIRQKRQRARTILKKIENDIALLLVRNNHFH